MLEFHQFLHIYVNSLSVVEKNTKNKRNKNHKNHKLV
jgi:hypothetical protein